MHSQPNMAALAVGALTNNFSLAPLIPSRTASAFQSKEAPSNTTPDSHHTSPFEGCISGWCDPACTQPLQLFPPSPPCFKGCYFIHHDFTELFWLLPSTHTSLVLVLQDLTSALFLISLLQDSWFSHFFFPLQLSFLEFPSSIWDLYLHFSKNVTNVFPHLWWQWTAHKSFHIQCHIVYNW